jgi:ribosomal protein S18 acetylase RimI-like enzyme
MWSNISPVQIRQAVDSDASQMASLLREAFLEFRSDYTPEAFTATVLNAETIQNRLKEGPSWVAFENEILVGTASAVPKSGGLYIRSMAVSPRTRGQGIGKLLLVQVEDFATEKRFNHLILSTTPFLLNAIRLYESCGFQRNSDGPDDLCGTPLFTMVKILR